MPILWTFLARNWKVVGILVLAAFFLFGAYKLYGSVFDKGKAQAQIEQIEKQDTQTRVVNKTFRKVDNEAPITANRVERSKWLRSVQRAN